MDRNLNLKLIVFKLLSEDKKTRENDLYLFQKVCMQYAIENNLDVNEIEKATKQLEYLPLYSSLLRTRQELQAKFPELQTDNISVLEKRRKYELILKEYYSQCVLPGFELSTNDIDLESFFKKHIKGDDNYATQQN